MKPAPTLDHACRWTPNGSQTMSKAASNFPVGWPQFLRHAAGAQVWDSDGRPYVDWTMGLAAVALGYGHWRVRVAVEEALAAGGGVYSLPSAREGQVAEALCRVIPCAEQVRFVKSGSEAAEGAIRVARAATQRPYILSIGYHSWHSWYAATRPEHPGVPEPYERLVADVPYNDLTAAEAQMAYDFGRWGAQCAAIFVEPTLVEPPAPGYLEGLRTLAGHYGALLIYDEVVTGFRWATGGYQAVCGVLPDLAIFGKAMANGIACGALVGREAVMRHAVWVSGTFGGDTLALAAMQAVLDVHADQDVCGMIRTAGEGVMEAFQRAHRAVAPDLPVGIYGQPQHPAIRFEETDGRMMTAFLSELAVEGVLLHPSGFNPATVHTPALIERTQVAFTRALARTRAAVQGGGALDEKYGRPLQLGFRPVA